MVKTIFFQDIRNNCNYNDNIRGYSSRDRLVSALHSIIKLIEKEIVKSYNLKKSKLHCKEEKEQIENFLEERLKKLIDIKTDLIRQKKKIYDGGKDVNIEEELERVLGCLPKIKND